MITLCCLQFTFQRFQIGQHADDLDIVANDATEHAIAADGHPANAKRLEYGMRCKCVEHGIILHALRCPVLR